MNLPRPNYYQGILQLRDVNEDVVDFVYTQVKKRNDVAISKTVKLPNGFDFYMTSQKFLRALGKKLKESFGGEMKMSARLHTKKNGKDLYRVNVLFRLLKHKAGDVVVVRGDEVRILNIGKKIFGREMKTGRKIFIRYNDMPKE